jgi:hypothetical protein
MTAGMEIQESESQVFAAAHFIEKGLARPGTLIGFGVSQVYQIAVVGQNVLGFISGVFTVAMKRIDTLGGKWPRLPLALVFGEEGKSSGSYGPGVERRIFHAAADTDMGANILHLLLLYA